MQANPPSVLESFRSEDAAAAEVIAAFAAADPDGQRTAAVLRSTFDQLYDGQRTGRYRWDQLFKTEKTHFGTLFEINLRREFDDIIADGETLDYRIAGYEIDCKYSQSMNGWMLPPECFGHLLLVCTANDANSEWSLGIVRATPENLRQSSANRDGKTNLSPVGRSNIHWLQWGAELPPNVLLSIAPEVQERVFAPKSGQQRLNELFRSVQNLRIGRNTVATLAQQDDYMKRARSNGGSRTALQPEGILVIGGDYAVQRSVAENLGAVVPQPGEFVSLTVVPALDSDPNTVYLDGRLWRLADGVEPVSVAAPELPKSAKRKSD